MIGSEESKILFKYVVFFNAITLSPFLTVSLSLSLSLYENIKHTFHSYKYLGCFTEPSTVCVDFTKAL